ncbi:galactose-1-epimerase [Vibrio sp. S4M6]|uniref:galactose-1-epimerase n=1 Tax=Vibrio sinus TaxID=2946865 RepID=UPI00202A6CB3|nr:galactose-1-epimerase [Vibrio sinus]MCL9781412.1 galactose-1-epimerase [Vibrio sinus]
MSLILEKSMTQTLAHDGAPAKVLTLSSDAGLSIVIMDIGATWLSCQLDVDESEKRELLLGVSNIDDFQNQECYLGATIGRYANRIEQGRFQIGDKTYQVDTNQAGNCLHGGRTGFDKKRWTLVEQTRNKAVLTLSSPDGEQGFPGNLAVSVTYQVTSDNTVDIRYHATTDSPTPVNLTNHAYFNLSAGETDCRTHQVRINADQYLPTNQNGIPLDKPVSVEGTGFDFRQSKTLAQDFLLDDQQNIAKGYDHSFVLNPVCRQGEVAAQVTSPDGKVQLSVFTDKPAMQLYTGNWLAGTPNRQQGKYIDYAGFALETQFLPDAPNHPEWQQPSCILKPGEVYQFSTQYQFKTL